ncbi:hypothetical protein GCM10027046_36000 [Uliginosibacterium flavum]|uniref:SoxR reducing system RseC family protein n=1 Tax=Uliginosibacterium flavum TaxID=1396831 RepID=A0ABV2TQN4_9RHOO
MQSEGVVTRIDGARAYVKVMRAGGCGRCHEAGGCGGVNQDESRAQEFLVMNSFGANVGQQVRLEIPDGATVMAALLAYGLPLLALVLGAAAASFVWQTDLAAALGAASGLMLAVLCAYCLRGIGFLQRAQPRITGLVMA